MTTYPHELELYKSSAYQLLYQGEDPHSFVQCLSRLQTNDRGRFEKLDGIASRLIFIEQLQHVSRNKRLNEDLLIAYTYNIDRLCAHLSATCVEIAATQDHYPFPEWLKRKFALNPRPDAIVDAIPALMNTSSPIEMEKKLLEWIKKLYDRDYLEEAGLVRAFRRIFDNLPEWLSLWLSNVYFIEKGHVLAGWLDPSTSKWLQSQIRDRCRIIADYLYNQVRNRYTHTVHYFPTMENEGISSMQFGTNQYLFNYFHEYGNLDRKLELSVGLKEGFAESDIIRLIVVYVLRSWLGIFDDERFLENYWRFYNNRKLLYDLLNEIYSNSKKIEQWTTYHLYAGISEFSNSRRIHKLSDAIAKITLNRLNDLDLGTLDFELQNYLYSIEVVNNEIIDFEANLQALERRQPYTIEIFVQKLTGHPQLKGVVRHMRSIEVFICHILKIPMHFESFPHGN
jgi:hypothetical protein